MRKVMVLGLTSIRMGSIPVSLSTSQRGWKEKISFLQMDANSLGFAPETFHTVLANFVGWDDCYDFRRMEFISRDKLTLEIKRVLKTGGRVGIGSWVEQSDLDWIRSCLQKISA